MSAPKKIYLSKLVMAGAKILDKPVSDDDVEYIRADVLRSEIERLIEESDFDESANLYSLLSFLDSTKSEKPIPNDLEEAAKEKYPFATTPPHDARASGWYNAAQVKLQKAFIAGAEWQKEQMMEEVVEGEVCIPNVWVEHKEGKELVVRAEISKELGFKFGEKVRVIVLPKED